MKWFRLVTLMVITLIDVMGFLYLLKLIFPFSESMDGLVFCSTFVLILVALLLAIVDFVASKIARTSLGINSTIVKTHNIIFLVLFMLYFTVFKFVAITNGLEGGSDEYVAKSDPVFILLFSGTLLDILSFI